MHEAHLPLVVLQNVRLAVAVALVDERSAAGGLRHARREIAPLRDGAEAFVQENQRRPGACAPDPFIRERVARRLYPWHAASLAALRASSASSSPSVRDTRGQLPRCRRRRAPPLPSR